MPALDERSPTAQRLTREVGRAIADFQLISDGDRLMVAVSGGKDSYALLVVLEAMQRRAPVDFELVAVHLDQGQPGYDGRPLADFLRDFGVPYRILREDTYSVVTAKVPEGKTYCSLCSRLRRGVLYGAAADLGCNKIALGHHRDDAIETLLLNVFFAGKLAAMPARLRTDDGRFEVIRPLIYTAEETLRRFADEQRFPILPCQLCGSQEDAQRRNMKALLDDLSVQHPQIRANMLAALGNIVPSHLLDPTLATGLQNVASPSNTLAGLDGATRPRGAETPVLPGPGARLRVVE